MELLRPDVRFVWSSMGNSSTDGGALDLQGLAASEACLSTMGRKPVQPLTSKRVQLDYLVCCNRTRTNGSPSQTWMCTSPPLKYLMHSLDAPSSTLSTVLTLASGASSFRVYM